MFHVGNDRLAIEISAKECQVPDDLRARLMPRFENLGHATEEFGQSQFWLTIVFHPRTEVYHAQGKLKLPGETIITGDRNPYLDIAIERCLEKVRQRIDAYRADPDREVRERVLRQVNQATDIIAPVEPDSGQLGQAATAGDYPTFRRALLGHEEWVRMRVGRWIQRYPEIQDQVGQSFAIADLVEEVFLTAFERYPQRPAYISLHKWLDSLIDPSVKDFWNDPEDRMAASFAQSLAS
jgi:hypothetical protein